MILCYAFIFNYGFVLVIQGLFMSSWQCRNVCYSIVARRR